jgi:oligopeptide transport system permease protein
VTVVAACVVLLIIIMGIVGPYINTFTHTAQNISLQTMPPRIPGLERLGIFTGEVNLTIQRTTLPVYEATGSVVRILNEFDQPIRGGSVPMVEIRYNKYIHLGIEDTYYWFGSDKLGRDLFTRLWQGTRISLIMAFAVSFITLILGLIIGSVCGYYGGWIDLIIERIKEVLWNIPNLPLFILLILMWGTSLRTLITVFVIQGWMGMASGVRVQFYRFKNREYVLASRTMGASDKRIMYKYILPNAAGTMITQMALTVPFVVFQEAALSYIGLGIQPPATSIGMLLMDGQGNLMDYPFMIVSPGIVIVLLMLAFNLFGNGLRDAFNPTLRQ